MTELEKLKAGLEYCFTDPEIAACKTAALKKCQRLNSTDPTDIPAMQQAAMELFGSVGKDVSIQPNFNCDFGMNIHVGDNFLTNYNVTILDVAPYRRRRDDRSEHADHRRRTSAFPQKA